VDVEEAAAAFMISLDFFFGDAAAADDVVLELNCCCIEVTARFLKANDVEEVNADGGILIRDVFVGTAICEVADVDVAMMMQQLRPAKRKAADDDREEQLLLPEALGLDFLGATLICIELIEECQWCY